MPYNEKLANRVREIIFFTHKNVEEKKMFGGLCFMVNDKMCLGVEKQRLMVRLNPAKYHEAIEKEGSKPMDFTGKIMKGYVFVDIEALNTKKKLEYWISLALEYNIVAKASKKRIKNNFMQSKATTIDAYIAELPKDRQKAITELRKVIKKNLPKGFKEEMNYGMIGYVVPHSKYPAGYHCNPELPLPFLNIASQKNFIALYHIGVYANPKLMQWFTEAHAKASPKKIDIGKSCVRYKKIADIPYELIGELATKITADEWIALYEKNLKRK